MRFNETLAADVATFGKAMIASRDIDPLYDVLRELYRMLGLDEEARLWFTSLYLAYYNLPSALIAWSRYPRPDPTAGLGMGLPIATERRGLRAGDNLSAHIADLIHHFSTYGSGHIHDWMTAGWDSADPEHNFLLFWDKAQTIYQNGRWAAFKWLDLLKNVHGYPVSAPDMRMEFCTGPKEGLQLLFSDTTDRVEALNAYGWRLRNYLGSAGLLIDWEQLETILCNFKSLYKGKYYVGHDIDELQERIEHAVSHAGLRRVQADLLHEARYRSLPHAYLGELRDWSGVQKNRMRAYADARRILVRQ